MTDVQEHTFPLLFGTDLHGNVKLWGARIYMRDATAYSEITYGRKDGKMQTSLVEYTTGKNIGKANETTPYQQCMFETERKWKDHLEKKHYTQIDPTQSSGVSSIGTTRPDAPYNIRITPMLAKTWTKPLTSATKPKKTDIVFPCWVQPKLDGLRCLVFLENGKCICQSRTGGEFIGLNHIVDIAMPILMEHPTWILDGELYTTTMPFEELAGIIKRKTRDECSNAQLREVEYHVYDIYDPVAPERTFSERANLIQQYIVHEDHKIVPVRTEEAHTPSDIETFFGEFIVAGYEGIILRNKAGVYVPNHRSFHLQKYKEFMEQEYPIVGFTSGVGKYQNCVIWICAYNNSTFQVVPRGTIEQKRRWFAEGANYIGKQLTVIFQQKSESGCPRFPVGKDVRDGY